MSFTIDDLRAARMAGCLDEPSLERLLAFLATRETATQAAAAPRFDLSHLLWYADREPHTDFLTAVEACPCEVSRPAARSAGARPGTFGGADEALLHRAGEGPLASSLDRREITP